MQRKRLDKKQFRKTLLYTVIFLLSLCAVLGLFALKAYAACSHQYVNGNCIYCGIPCQSCETGEMQSYSYTNFNGTNQHVIYRTCDECGLETNEGLEDCNFNLQNVCMDCGHSKTVDSECVFHTFLMGICETCGYECPHSEYQDSVCSLCGITCIHSNIDMHYNQSSSNIHQHILAPYCADCDIGLVTDHPDCSKAEACSYDKNGKCTKCFRSCLHEYGFENGICPVCNYGCGHSAGSTYTYDPISSSTSYHSVKAWCVTCGERNTGDSQNGAHVKCTFSNGKCTFCKRVCGHDSRKTVYNSRANDYVLHDVVVTCNICKVVTTSTDNHSYDNSNTCQSCGLVCAHERWTDGKCTYCSFACQHGSYKDGKCSTCGKACSHSSVSTSYSQISNDYALHNVIKTCNTCKQQVSSDTANHTYSGSTCSACNLVCTHERWTDGKCTYCSFACQHGTYEDYKCSICNLACNHPSTTGTVVYSTNPSTHKYIYYCDVCNFATKTIFLDHSFKNGKCNSCGFVCTHSSSHIEYSLSGNEYHFVNSVCDYCSSIVSSTKGEHSFQNGKCIFCSYVCSHSSYSDGICIYCDYLCPHTTILRRVASSDGRDHEFYCADCDFSSLYELPLSFSQYFSYAPFPCSWNADTSVMYESSELSGYYRFFERYSINTFDESRGYNASAHIIGGSSIKDSFAFDSPINASRYLVLRVRLSGIKHLEVYAYGGDSAVVFEDVVNECSSIHIFDIENLPDGEWANLVIDMSLFNDIRNSTYSVGSKISHAFISLCFTYETVDSYADIEFFALCDDPSDIDSVVNFSATNSISHFYYLAEDSHSVNNTSVHYFESSDRCKYCGYTCEHDNHYTIDIVDDFECGVETRCELCDILIKSTVQPHSFVNNSHECARCLYVCEHKYSAGICIYCDWSCVHSYIGGSIKCSVCGSYVEYDGYDDKDGFLSLFTAIYDAQANTFFKMLGYEILGVNVAGLIVSVIALAVVIWLLKKVL